jgi:hypothetical protein
MRASGRVVAGGAALAVAAAACYGSGGFDPKTPTQMAAVSGDGQAAPVNAVLPNPLVVVVKNGQGSPVSGVVVHWLVLSGGGSIEPTSTTGQDGTAAATFTLGPNSGAQTAQAAVGNLAGSPVVFTAAAQPASGGGGGGGGGGGAIVIQTP